MTRIPTPLHDRIVVMRSAAKKMHGILHLPAMQYDDKTTTGTVVAIGSDVHDVKPLDNILFPKYCNNEIEVDGIKYLVLKEAEVFAITDCEAS